MPSEILEGVDLERAAVEACPVRQIERAGERAYKDAVAAGLTGEALNDVVTAAARKAFTRFTGYTYCGNGMVKAAG